MQTGNVVSRTGSPGLPKPGQRAQRCGPQQSTKGPMCGFERLRDVLRADPKLSQHVPSRVSGWSEGNLEMFWKQRIFEKRAKNGMHCLPPADS